MSDKISIRRGRYLAEVSGARMRSAYCEVTIAGSPHIVDMALVEGYSSLDHMADVPLAAAVEALSGKEFASEKACRTAAEQAMSASLPGCPRIKLTFAPGRLRERWLAENMDALRRKLGDGYRVPSVPSGYDFRQSDGEWVVRCERSGGYCLCTTEDDVYEPDASWTVGKDRYYV